MKRFSYLVFKPTVSSAGMFVYAVCSSRKAAEMARSRVAKGKRKSPGGTRYYDLPPDSSPYATEIRIVKVQVDVLYPNGLNEKKLHEFAGNLNEKEVIR